MAELPKKKSEEPPAGAGAGKCDVCLVYDATVKLSTCPHYQCKVCAPRAAARREPR